MFCRVLCALKIPRNLLKQVTNRGMVQTRSTSTRHRSNVKTGGLLCAAGIAIAHCTSTEDVDMAKVQKKKLMEVDPKTLTSSYLIQNAAKINVDSATTLLTQTTMTLLEIYQKYIETLDQLEKLQELMVSAHGQPHQEEKVADAILVVRKKLGDIKAAKQELEVLFSSVERLMNNVAEVSFFAGADHACTVANERLFAAQEKLNSAVETSLKAELSVRKQEAWIISETNKRQEELVSDQPNEDPPSDENKSQEIPLPKIGTRSSDGQSSNNSTSTQDDLHTQTNEGKLNDDWFSVILDENSATESLHSEDDFSEHEDERKWANSN